jgi:hypothetical protein
MELDVNQSSQGNGGWRSDTVLRVHRYERASVVARARLEAAHVEVEARVFTGSFEVLQVAQLLVAAELAPPGSAQP